MIHKFTRFLKYSFENVHSKLGFGPTTSIVAFIAIITLGVVFSEHVRPSEPVDLVAEGFDISASLYTKNSALLSDSSPIGEFQPASSKEDLAGFVLIDRGSFSNSSMPGTSRAGQDGLLTYEVREGDSLSVIASRFGISVDTIIWANNLKNSSLLRPGQEMVILPVSGILHEVESGETLNSIADKYDVDASGIRMFSNRLVVGDMVIVPDVDANVMDTRDAPSSDLPSADLAFPMIESYYNFGRIHSHNAVDIAALCGTPIYASDHGEVIDVGDPSRNNGGYGGYVEIEHMNNVRTLYAHTSENMVSEGDWVNREDKIAEVGNTGRVHGPTGCHVHFEVHGASNPFAR